MRKLIFAAFAVMSLSGGALAQGHAHGDQGPQGGRMQDVVGIHAELPNLRLRLRDRSTILDENDNAGLYRQFPGMAHQDGERLSAPVAATSLLPRER